MTYPAYLREKARHMRVESRLTIDEIAERLALSRTTVFYWVRDLAPLERKGQPNVGRVRAAQSNSRRYRQRREAAYAQGVEEFEELSHQPGFRDFVCMYIAEGYKRSRNRVSLANSDATVIRLADHWIRRFAKNSVTYGLQYHADQDLEELRVFWRRALRDPSAPIRLQRKSNSGQLAGRTWRSRFGVLTVSVGDTNLRARLQAWMDCVQWAWLEFGASGA